MFRVHLNGNYMKFSHSEIDSVFTVSGGNTKVMLPVVTFQSGINCVNAGKCKYSEQVREKGGDTPWCYAQKIERLRHNVQVSRDNNFEFVMECKRLSVLDEFAVALAHNIWMWREPRFIRFNESGDLDPTNTHVIVTMQQWFRSNNKKCKMYGYSKSGKILKDRIRNAGGVVNDSDRDFIVVKSKQEAKSKGLVVCPGKCGPCTRCMDGYKTAVIAH